MQIPQLLLFTFLTTAAHGSLVPPPTYRFSFGSCFNHPTIKKDSEIFKHIAADYPEAFVWLGDFAYLDVMKWYRFFPRVYFEYDTLPNIVAKLNKTQYDPNYTLLRERAKIYGIWDDHDSGINDGGKMNKIKEEVRQVFLDYIGEPKDSKRRTQLGGMYTSHYLDPHHRIKLILLDGRYSRDELLDNALHWDDKDSLGKEQEEWLKEEVEGSEAVFTFIANGYQMLPEDRAMSEKLYPKSRDFVLSLHNPRTNIILLSGDVHMAEVMTDPCSKHLHGYPIREITSSGLSHSIQLTVGQIVSSMLEAIFPDTFSVPEDRYLHENYALLDFYFDPVNPHSDFLLKLQIKGYDGTPRIYREYTPKDFTHKATPDRAAYDQCRKDLLPPTRRMINNIFVRAITFRHSFFHIWVSLVLALPYFLIRYLLLPFVRFVLRRTKRIFGRGAQVANNANQNAKITIQQGKKNK